MLRTAPAFDALAGLTALVALFLVAVPATTDIQPWVKAAPAFLWALAFFAPPRRPGWGWGAVALGFAALGDFLLAGGTQVLTGASAFAAMQILYSFRFWDAAFHRPRPRRGLVALPLVFFGFTLLVLALVWPRLGSLAVPMAVYGVLLATTASGAAASGWGWKVALGGSLLFLSDTLILVFRAWPAGDPWASWAILVPYFLGQYLIVRTLRNGV